MPILLLLLASVFFVLFSPSLFSFVNWFDVNSYLDGNWWVSVHVHVMTYIVGWWFWPVSFGTHHYLHHPTRYCRRLSRSSSFLLFLSNPEMPILVSALWLDASTI
jgi:hypothetical protein